MNYVLRLDCLLSRRHDFFCNRSEHVNVALGIGANQINELAVVLLLEIGVNVLVYDF